MLQKSAAVCRNNKPIPVFYLAGQSQKARCESSNPLTREKWANVIIKNAVLILCGFTPKKP